MHGGGAHLKAQDGGDGRDRNGAGTLRGTRGRRGGSLTVKVAGHLTVCGGAQFENRDGGEVGYNKGATDTIVQRGGLAYDFRGRPSGGQPIQIELVALDLSGSPGCIVVAGAYSGQVVTTVGSPGGTGERLIELYLPPPQGVPFCDVIFLLGNGSFSFNDRALQMHSGSGGGSIPLSK